jgi:hypothetical protein
MTQLWLGILIAGAAGVAGLVLKRILSAGSNARAGIDVGAVSQGWLTEHRAGKREDRFS